MISLKVRNGTPQHGKSLCYSCQYSFIIKGEAVSEQVTYCNAGFNDARIVPFKTVTECSKHESKTVQSLHEMQKIAYILETDPRGKPIGFVVNKEFRRKEKMDKHDEIVETP